MYTIKRTRARSIKNLKMLSSFSVILYNDDHIPSFQCFSYEWNPGWFIQLVIQLCIYILTIIFRLESRTKEKRNTFINSDRKGDTQVQSPPTIIARRFVSFLTVSRFRDGIFTFSSDIISRFSIKSDPDRNPRDCNFQEWWQVGLLLRRRETRCFVKITLATPEPEVGSEGQRRT